MKKILTVIVCFAASVFIVFFSGSFFAEKASAEDQVIGLFDQHVTEVTERPQIVHMLYQDGRLIGAVRNTARLDQMLKDVYSERYEDDFPNSRLDLGMDV